MRDDWWLPLNSTRLLQTYIAVGLIIPTFSAVAHANCAPPKNAPPLCLTGIALSDTVKIATVAESNAQLEREVGLGDPIGDWHVTDISPQYITVDKDGQTFKLTLSDFSGGKLVEPPAVKHGSIKSTHILQARGEREGRL